LKFSTWLADEEKKKGKYSGVVGKRVGLEEPRVSFSWHDHGNKRKSDGSNLPAGRSEGVERLDSRRNSQEQGNRKMGGNSAKNVSHLPGN